MRDGPVQSGPLPLVEVCGLSAFYGKFQALYDIDIALFAGEVVSIVGSNGAGKSTLLKSIMGLDPVVRGAIRFAGTPLGSAPPHERVAMGIALVPEGRRLFPSLTVSENLVMGRSTGRASGTWTLDRIFGLFPVLHAKRAQKAGHLSGGQQQMVAIGRALLSGPRVLLCDEFSLGLAPAVIEQIYGILPEIRASGVSLLLVEQDVRRSLAVADRFYCMLEGRISLQGRPGDVDEETIRASYFGIPA